MPRRLHARLALVFVCALALLRTTPARAATPAAITDAVRTAAETTLAAEAPGVRLLAASLQDHRLTLDFSRELLALAPGSLRFEQFSRRLHVAVADPLREHFTSFEVRTLVEGTALPRLLDVTAPPPTAALAAPPESPAFPTPHALAARRIALSPGHGYYLNGTRWVLQRDFFSGIVEDFVNHDLITLVNGLLVEAGADVRPTRNLDRDAGPGESGFPKWQEAARYHVKALGADPSVWNESGFTHLEQDIRSRPRYANAIGAEVLVSVHNNGGGGTGTETLYDNANAAAAESRRLADALHTRVIAAIRRDYDPAWADRRVQGFNGNYGENRLATRPAVIMEIAFMDRPTPDNAALRDDRFKRIVATAIRDGLRDYFDAASALPPAAPTALIATGDPTAIALTWTDHASTETGFRIERRTPEATTWTTLGTVAANVTTYRDATGTAGASYLYRVHAFNAAGSSVTPSNEAAATLAPGGRPGLVLTLADASAAPLVRDWQGEVALTFTLADTAGRAVPEATLVVTETWRGDAPVAQTVAGGSLVFRTTVPAGQANGTYALNFQATRAGFAPSNIVTRSVQVSHAASSATGAPTFVTQPAAASVAAGETATLTAVAQGAVPLSYQWRLNGTPIAGATHATLTLERITAASAGSYSVLVTNPAGSRVSETASVSVSPGAWLANVSLRTSLAAGQGVIVGFVVAGGAKDVLVRAAGPALLAFGLAGAMPDPRLELFRGSTRVFDNNDWPAALAPTIASLGAFPFPAASRDAALLQTLDGAHTVQVTGTAAGLVLIEGYDAGRGSAVRFANLSARNRVGTGADILIAGFYLAGTGTQRVLVRAVGPGLTALGVTGALADPRLEVHDATGLVAANDNWDAALAATFAQVAAFPLTAGSRDAALVLTLPAGRTYTAQVFGAAGTTGEALIEIYELP